MKIANPKKLTEKEIFHHLFEIAKTSKDPEGVVAACLVKDKRIFVISPSSDDSIYHAEFLVVKKAKESGIPIDNECILYTTLEPCSDLPAVNDGIDCTTCLLDAGVKMIVYGANDPEYSKAAGNRFRKAGVNYRKQRTKKDRKSVV